MSEKTPGQVAREALTLEETAREVAKEKQSKAGGQNPGSLCARVHKADESKHWDKEVADDLGVGK